MENQSVIKIYLDKEMVKKIIMENAEIEKVIIDKFMESVIDELSKEDFITRIKEKRDALLKNYEDYIEKVIESKNIEDVMRKRVNEILKNDFNKMFTIPMPCKEPGVDRYKVI